MSGYRFVVKHKRNYPDRVSGFLLLRLLKNPKLLDITTCSNSCVGLVYLELRDLSNQVSVRAGVPLLFDTGLECRYNLDGRVVQRCLWHPSYIV